MRSDHTLEYERTTRTLFPMSATTGHFLFDAGPRKKIECWLEWATDDVWTADHTSMAPCSWQGWWS